MKLFVVSAVIFISVTHSSGEPWVYNVELSHQSERTLYDPSNQIRVNRNRRETLNAVSEEQRKLQAKTNYKNQENDINSPDDINAEETKEGRKSMKSCGNRFRHAVELENSVSRSLEANRGSDHARTQVAGKHSVNRRQIWQPAPPQSEAYANSNLQYAAALATANGVNSNPYNPYPPYGEAPVKGHAKRN